MEMKGWRFSQKPVGLELYFLKLKLNFTFFFIFFLSRVFLFSFFWERFYGIGNQTPPSTAVPSFFGRDEERRGGIAAIEQPRLTGNGT